MDEIELKVKITKIDKDDFVFAFAPKDDLPSIELRRIILSRVELTAIFAQLMEMALKNNKEAKKKQTSKQ